MRLISWLVKLVIALVVIVIITIGVLFFIIDGDSIKRAIADQIKSETGLVLQFNGEANVKFFPKLAVHTEDLVLLQADAQTPIASIKRADIAVALMPLFSRSIQAQVVSVEGLYARYQVNADGSSNVDPILSIFNHDATSSDLDPTDINQADWSNFEIKEISLPAIELSQSVIEYLDKRSNQAISVGVNHLRLAEIDINARSTSIELDVLVTQNNAAPISHSGSAQLLLEDDGNRLVLENNEWLTETADYSFLDQGLSWTAQRLFWQNNSQKLQLQGLTFASQALAGSGELYAQLGNNLTWNANLQIAPFKVNDIAYLLPSGVSAYGNSSVALNNVALSGDSQRLQIKNLKGKFDDSSLSGDVSYPYQSGVTQLDLNIDQLNADQYLSSGASSGASSGSSAPLNRDQALLPTATLRALRLNGNVNIGQLTYQGYQVKDVRCQLAPGNSDRNVINCDLASAQHPLSLRLAAFVGNQSPLIGADAQIDGMSISTLLAETAAAGVATGSLAGNVSMNANGESISSWTNTLKGDFNFDVDQPVLVGVNVNNLIIDAIGQSKISQLESILDMTGNSLPRELSENTELVDTRLVGNVESGIVKMNNINLATVNGDAISGSGQIRLVDMQADMQFKVKLRALQRHDYLSDFEWPVTCSGVIGSQSLSQLCGGAVGNLQTIVSEVVKRRARQEAESLAKSEIEKITGVKLGEGSIEDALKNEANNQLQKQQQDLQDKINQERQKAQDDLEKRLKEEVGNTLLKGLFGN